MNDKAAHWHGLPAKREREQEQEQGGGGGGGGQKKICLDCMMCEIGCCFLLFFRQREREREKERGKLSEVLHFFLFFYFASDTRW